MTAANSVVCSWWQLQIAAVYSGDRCKLQQYTLVTDANCISVLWWQLQIAAVYSWWRLQIAAVYSWWQLQISAVYSSDSCKFQQYTLGDSCKLPNWAENRIPFLVADGFGLWCCNSSKTREEGGSSFVEITTTCWGVGSRTYSILVKWGLKSYNCRNN